MKRAVYKNGEIKIIETQMPTLKGKGAIIKVHGCGLCGSDIVKIREKIENPILGHEVVGEIIEINSDTDFKINDKVALGHHYPCFECEYCKNDSFSMCETFKKTNIEPCGFAEYIYVTEGHLKNTVFKVPENLSDDEISFLEPLACVIRAIERAQIKQGQKALVMGLGSIGNLMAQSAKIYGADVYGYDINEKRQKYSKLSFDKNLKYNIIFMTSGATSAIDDAVKYVLSGGKIIVFSSVKDLNGYTNNDIYYRELSIIGSYSPAPYDYKISYDLLKEGKINTKGMSTTYNLDNLKNAIDDTINNKIMKAFIKI
ncbi:MAG: hypothetical protein E7Z91_06855 [Cyanobacteria bacterium SIG30]|nr:hypothetical protein [Cyanobacteria bacterium SIG30]